MSILIAIDNEEGSSAVLSTGAELAEGLNKDLVVVHVTPERRDKSEAKSRLDSLVETVLEDPDEATIVIEQGDAAVEILDEAEDWDAEYIVLGSRKRSPIGKALMGSVSQMVMLNSDVPVVCVTQERE
jgi:nucleotide-binding universal stress UspA family protein